jgi:GxxExxY protein
MSKIIHKELSYAVNGCIFGVHNDVGPGLREECYQRAMEVRLRDDRIRFASKPHTRRELWHRGEVADVFEPDFVVEDSLILELKSQREGLSRANFIQTLNYLKCWDLPLGLLTNFAEAQSVIERVPFEPRNIAPDEDYRFIKPMLTPRLREELRVVRDALLAVHREFGIGYSDTTYRSLVDIETRYRGLTCQRELQVTPELNGQHLPISPITPLRIGQDILVEVEALHDHITARAVRTMQSHLKFTGAKIGVIVNFGKNSFDIRGVRPLKN